MSFLSTDVTQAAQLKMNLRLVLWEILTRRSFMCVSHRSRSTARLALVWRRHAQYCMWAAKTFPENCFNPKLIRVRLHNREIKGRMGWVGGVGKWWGDVSFHHLPAHQSLHKGGSGFDSFQTMRPNVCPSGFMHASTSSHKEMKKTLWFINAQPARHWRRNYVNRLIFHCVTRLSSVQLLHSSLTSRLFLHLKASNSGLGRNSDHVTWEDSKKNNIKHRFWSMLICNATHYCRLHLQSTEPSPCCFWACQTDFMVISVCQGLGRAGDDSGMVYQHGAGWSKDSQLWLSANQMWTLHVSCSALWKRK